MLADPTRVAPPKAGQGALHRSPSLSLFLAGRRPWLSSRSRLLLLPGSSEYRGKAAIDVLFHTRRRHVQQRLTALLSILQTTSVAAGGAIGLPSGCLVVVVVVRKDGMVRHAVAELALTLAVVVEVEVEAGRRPTGRNVREGRTILTLGCS